MRSRYAELRPPRSVSDRVLCLWTQHIDAAGGEYHHPVLPDGCVDIVWIGDALPVVAGPATQPILVALPAGASLIGARLRPGWAASSLGMPVDQLLNQHVPFADIGTGPLGEGLGRHRSLSAGLRCVSTALERRFAGSVVPDPMIQAAVAWLVRHPAARVRHLAHLTGLSERQLHRRFKEAVGYGPKAFQRIMRFQRLLMAACERRELAFLAADGGYADQAHMCREVSTLAGETPQRLLGRTRSTLSMSDLFNTGEGHGGYLSPP